MFFCILGWKQTTCCSLKPAAPVKYEKNQQQGVNFWTFYENATFRSFAIKTWIDNFYA